MSLTHTTGKPPAPQRRTRAVRDERRGEMPAPTARSSAHGAGHGG